MIIQLSQLLLPAFAVVGFAEIVKLWTIGGVFDDVDDVGEVDVVLRLSLLTAIEYRSYLTVSRIRRFVDRGRIAGSPTTFAEA